MDSTLTLVNPIPATQYYFSANSMKNTTVFVHQSRPLYNVSTELKSDKQTRVSDAHTGRLIALVERREIFSDTVTFPNQNGGQALSIHKWLQKSKLADGYTVHLMQTSHRQYIWKSDSRHRLGLYKESDQTQPIAYLQPVSATQNFALVLESSAEAFRDDVLVAFLILEQRLRISERNVNVGGGKFEANKTVLGHYAQT
ncbi:hypothetical protein PAXINDRAFT_172043 [Paxillus involutus ATCC 200175]|uniref:DUF6593 domain-containing protein n=1 Tax=Paxillus involutus ATCC 200175 TaxID=664439 RepID=A0A0C9SRZ0_PAXIN|nr:hypothetical protein PAXINDRAFT_172043 [Paxillus involutus ATCC 200175]